MRRKKEKEMGVGGGGRREGGGGKEGREKEREQQVREEVEDNLILKRVTAVLVFIISCIMCKYCTVHVNAAVYIVKLVYTINYTAAVHSHD